MRSSDRPDHGPSIVTAPAVSTGPELQHARDAADVLVTNADDDSAGHGTVAALRPTTEAGGTPQSSRWCSPRQPTAERDDCAQLEQHGQRTVTPASLTFTNVAQTVTGVDDQLHDPYGRGDEAPDSNYNNVNAAITILSTDNDVVGITVSSISGPTTGPEGRQPSLSC